MPIDFTESWKKAQASDIILSMTVKKVKPITNFDHLKRGRMYQVSIRPDDPEFFKRVTGVYPDPTDIPYRAIRRGSLLHFAQLRPTKEEVGFIHHGDKVIYLEQTEYSVKVIAGETVGWLDKDQMVRFKRITARKLRRST